MTNHFIRIQFSVHIRCDITTFVPRSVNVANYAIDCTPGNAGGGGEMLMFLSFLWHWIAEGKRVCVCVWPGCRITSRALQLRHDTVSDCTQGIVLTKLIYVNVSWALRFPIQNIELSGSWEQNMLCSDKCTIECFAFDSSVSRATRFVLSITMQFIKYEFPINSRPLFHRDNDFSLLGSLFRSN